jgi:hypothetical protein
VTRLWDRPPLPRRGDPHEDITFSYVGRVVTAWEAVEFELSRLYTWFRGSLDDTSLMRDYGAGRIFRERAERLNAAAEKFFISQPSQEVERQFFDLLLQTKGYAERRNDIAHGMVFQIDHISHFRRRMKIKHLGQDHFAVIPPLYANRFHNEAGLPSFAYTSVEMSRLISRFSRIRSHAKEFRKG